jgi:hypothetical protein
MHLGSLLVSDLGKWTRLAKGLVSFGTSSEAQRAEQREKKRRRDGTEEGDGVVKIKTARDP